MNARMYDDRPGDSRNPNSPDYVEPVFDVSDAAYNVAQRMVTRNRIGQADYSRVAEVIAEMAEALPALNWVKDHAGMPELIRQRIEWLAITAEAMDKAIGDTYEELNRAA